LFSLIEILPDFPENKIANVHAGGENCLRLFREKVLVEPLLVNKQSKNSLTLFLCDCRKDEIF